MSILAPWRLNWISSWLVALPAGSGEGAAGVASAFAGAAASAATDTGAVSDFFLSVAGCASWPKARPVKRQKANTQAVRTLRPTAARSGHIVRIGAPNSVRLSAEAQFAA